MSLPSYQSLGVGNVLTALWFLNIILMHIPLSTVALVLSVLYDIRTYYDKWIMAVLRQKIFIFLAKKTRQSLISRIYIKVISGND